MKLEERRSTISALLIVLLFLSSWYFFAPSFNNASNSKVKSNDNKKKLLENKYYTACDKVDIPWLAGDRIYWNGWEPKAMFMKADGTFTKSNVYIKEGDEICIVVLLGPTPAYSPQFETDHIGPTDSITMFAQGEHTKQTIQLEQHTLQTNAYFASVKFRHQDTYELSAIEEYRSYFWETPISHAYHPNPFVSENKLVVKLSDTTTTNQQRLPICQLNNTNLDLSGAWVDPSVYGSSNRESLYTMYEGSHPDFLENGKVFIPHSCLLEFKSNGYGSQCLNGKTVHVWGDNNIRRNLKAFNFNTGNWCDPVAIATIKDEDEQREAARCICKDDHEDNIYPWINDPYTPITMDNAWGINSYIYYNRVEGTLDSAQLFRKMSKFTKKNLTPPDYVILGLGNDDVQALRVSPKQFHTQFSKTIVDIRRIYPTQPILVRTPQYFCCGVIPMTSWNAGRSITFTQIVRDIVKEQKNMYLWDVHLLGTNENTCEGSAYTKRNVVNMENLLLWNFICPSK